MTVHVKDVGTVLLRAGRDEQIGNRDTMVALRRQIALSGERDDEGLEAHA